MAAEVATLIGRTIGAGSWTIGARLVAKLIDLALLVCLARFLGPSAFALVAAAMAVVFIVEALFELPMAAALIRVPVLTRAMLDTAFTLGLLRGLCIAALLALLAWPLSVFNHEPRLLPLVCVLALAPALRGLVSPRMVEFVRRLEFRPDVALELSGKIVAFVVSIALAAATGSYWAIAAATVCTPLVATALSYVLAPLRPRLDLSAWPHFSNMVGWNFLSQLGNAFNWQIDRLLLPRFSGSVAFGQYAMAKQISEIPDQALLVPLQRPLMAALATPGADHRAHYLQVVRAIALVMAPVLVLLMAWPEPLVRVALGPDWMAAAHWLRLLGVVSLLGLPGLPMPAMAMIRNRASAIALVTFSMLAARVPLVWLGALHFGIAGAIAGSAVSAALGATLAMLVIRALIGLGVARQLAALLPATLSLLPATALLLATRDWVMATASFAELLARAGACGLLYLAIYGGLVLACWRLAGRPPGLEAHLVSLLRRQRGSPRRQDAADLP